MVKFQGANLRFCFKKCITIPSMFQILLIRMPFFDVWL
ncbi:hypothetical protein AQPE_3439 [Aquipluma nitroreducens]|uniref:Uncharacterized protein n=1 Tax=Aquipluma nitroreducens TaxID=2010828 RepID=A0A5K7SCE8_9BACT|nr:hypothetical protein AQPE_3439 [Aquipluma nitroreducens]